jgi:hypothetical protein
MIRMRPLLLSIVLFAPWGAPLQAQEPEPYTLQMVVSLLEGGWAGSRILTLLKTECVSFRVNAATEVELRGAGADAPLLNGLRNVCYRGPAPPAPRQTQQPRGFVYIEGEMPPGWQRVVNELPPNTNRTIDLTPGRPAIIVVTAPGWCTDRLEITLHAAEERRWTPVLRARPWIGDC